MKRIFVYIALIVQTLIVFSAMPARNLVFMNENKDYVYSFEPDSGSFRYYKVVYQDTNVIVGKFQYERAATWNNLGMKIEKISCPSVDLVFGNRKSTSAGKSHIQIFGFEENKIDSLVFYNSSCSDSITVVPADKSSFGTRNGQDSQTDSLLPFKAAVFKVYKGKDNTGRLRFSELNLNEKRCYKTGIGKQIMIVERSLFFQGYEPSYKDISMIFGQSVSPEASYVWLKPGVLRLAQPTKKRHYSRGGITPSHPTDWEEKDSTLYLEARRFVPFGD